MGHKYLVAGVTGFTGTYIVRQLIKIGAGQVTVLTNHPCRPNEFGSDIAVFPYSLDNSWKLLNSIEDVECVVNTYWVRLNFKNSSFEQAVRDSKLLVNACKEAGVKRFVYISVLNPSHDYRYEYYRGKMEVEDYIRESGLSYAILRPGLMFGAEEILLNNIAWLIRKYRLFIIFGSGKYKVTPVYVDDVAREAVRQSIRTENVTEDLIGPETYEFGELIELIARETGTPLRTLHLSRVLSR